MPVMVCMDGFILTHAYERVDIPDQAQVDEFLPPFQPRQVLDPIAPLSMGAMVGPEAFTEVRYLAHHKQQLALDLISKQAAEFETIFGRDSGGLIKSFEAEGAETVVVTMGSVIGTMKEVLGGMREDGITIGALTIRSFRPFPGEALRAALKDAKRVIVFEKSVAVGMGGILAMNLRTALQDLPIRVHSVIGGLGGRPVTRVNLRRMFDKGIQDQLEEPHFHDIRMDVMEREIEREQADRRSGAIAENVLTDVGVVAAAKAI
jgi:pyruvate ferredoxin oxidoreductase alpha subunit